MEEILVLEGFVNNENPNEYVKGNWTVRLEDDLIEIFNNPEVSRGVYYCGPINSINLEDVLNEIANFEFNQALE